MDTEQQETLNILLKAIRMEIDGKEFYLKASRTSGNKLGTKLLKSLADAEDVHLCQFEDIYSSISQNKGWPEISIKTSKNEPLKNLFRQAITEIGKGIKPAKSELQDVETAMDMENKSYDYYIAISSNASHETGKSFLKSLAAEEREHYLLLLDYHEFLSDPENYFTTREHHSLDGG